MHPGSLRCSSLAYDKYASLLAPSDPGASASAFVTLLGPSPSAQYREDESATGASRQASR